MSNANADPGPGGHTSPTAGAWARVSRVVACAPDLAMVPGMDNVIVTWLVVGFIAGALASYVSRGTGFGLAGDIVLGIVGAFIGGWGFRELHWQAPFAGLPGMIFVAFVGAVALLFVIRLINGRRNR